MQAAAAFSTGISGLSLRSKTLRGRMLILPDAPPNRAQILRDPRRLLTRPIRTDRAYLRAAGGARIGHLVPAAALESLATTPVSIGAPGGAAAPAVWLELRHPSRPFVPDADGSGYYIGAG